ncbi:hypothetical protein V2J09_016861 [Rumex salicifolius]
MEVGRPAIIRVKDEMRKWTRAARAQGKTVGLVPTMGSLHNGHLSLIQQAHHHSELVVVSIYVNPGQFSTSEDISTYPSDFQGDIDKIMSVSGGVDVVFNPRDLYDYGDQKEIGVSNGRGRLLGDEKEEKIVSCLENRGGGGAHESWIRVEKLEKGLCGKSRPLFFRGVATVVCKLFNIVEPDVAFFGKKDYQQWRVIERMVRDLDFSVQVIGSEIVREEDGLAMSSRNVYLSPEERQKALSINKSLFKAKSAAEQGQINCRELQNLVIQSVQEAGGRVDYAEIVDQESLRPLEEIKAPAVFCIAALFGKARLIDNTCTPLKCLICGFDDHSTHDQSGLPMLTVLVHPKERRSGASWHRRQHEPSNRQQSGPFPDQVVQLDLKFAHQSKGAVVLKYDRVIPSFCTSFELNVKEDLVFSHGR